MANGDKQAKNGNGRNGRTGRPTRYDPERSPIIARAMCRLGSTVEELAEALGVCPRTVETWRKRHPEFLQALKEGRAAANARVEESLYQRAIGYTHTEERIVTEARERPGSGKSKGDAQQTKVVRKETITKTVAPDVTAQIFWLCNRGRGRWRHVQRIEHTGPDGGPIDYRDLSGYTDEELQRIAAGADPR